MAKNFSINEEGYLWHFDFQLFVFFQKYYKELLELCAQSFSLSTIEDLSLFNASLDGKTQRFNIITTSLVQLECHIDQCNRKLLRFLKINYRDLSIQLFMNARAQQKHIHREWTQKFKHKTCTKPALGELFLVHQLASCSTNSIVICEKHRVFMQSLC